MREQHKFKLIANTFEGLKRYAAVNEDFSSMTVALPLDPVEIML